MACKAQIAALLKSEGIDTTGPAGALDKLGFDVRTNLKRTPPETEHRSSAETPITPTTTTTIPVPDAQSQNHQLISISCNKLSTPPPMFWRPLCNTVIEIISSNSEKPDQTSPQKLSTRISRSPFDIRVVAQGVSEVFYPTTDESEHILREPEAYEIYPIVYGTVAWCWWRNGAGSEPSRWIVGTKRSIDCSTTPARGINLADVLWAHINRDKLDKNLTYSFLIHHRPLHGFAYPFETKILLIGIHDPTMERSQYNLQTLPGRQREESFSTSPHWTGSRSIIDNWFDESSSSLETLSTHSPSQDDPPCLGLILRCRTPTAQTCDLIIKSPLYSFIDRKFGEMIPIRNILSRIVLEDECERGIFVKIFPHFSNDVQAYERHLSEFAANVSITISEGLIDRQSLRSSAYESPTSAAACTSCCEPRRTSSLNEISTVITSILLFITNRHLCESGTVTADMILRIIRDRSFTLKETIADIIVRMEGIPIIKKNE